MNELFHGRVDAVALSSRVFFEQRNGVGDDRNLGRVSPVEEALYRR